MHISFICLLVMKFGVSWVVLMKFDRKSVIQLFHHYRHTGRLTVGSCESAMSIVLPICWVSMCLCTFSAFKHGCPCTEFLYFNLLIAFLHSVVSLHSDLFLTTPLVTEALNKAL